MKCTVKTKYVKILTFHVRYLRNDCDTDFHCSPRGLTFCFFIIKIIIITITISVAICLLCARQYKCYQLRSDFNGRSRLDAVRVKCWKHSSRTRGILRHALSRGRLITPRRHVALISRNQWRDDRISLFLWRTCKNCTDSYVAYFIFRSVYVWTFSCNYGRS